MAAQRYPRLASCEKLADGDICHFIREYVRVLVLFAICSQIIVRQHIPYLINEFGIFFFLIFKLGTILLRTFMFCIYEISK